MGIFFAVLSMVFAGLVDFTFKGYIRAAKQPLGNFLAGVGLVWTVSFAAAAMADGHWQWKGWRLSLAAGLTSILANVLLVAAMRRLDVGVCSTVYRLNLALVVVLAAVFLNEPITVTKLIGVALGAAAVLLMFEPGGDRDGRNLNAAVPFLALILAAVLRATMGLIYKLAMDAGTARSEFLAINGLCWLAGGTVLGLVLGEPLAPTRRGWGYAVLAGLIVCGDVLFLALAVKFGQASVVVPVSQLGFALTTVLGCMFLAEKLTARRVVALLSAAGCILVMSRV